MEITKEALEAMINAGVREAVAKMLTAKTVDERLSEEIARQRGTDRPSPHTQTLVPAVSPLTGSKFVARIVASRSMPGGRVVEMVDYERPDGWDKHERDGGKVPDDIEMRRPDGSESKRYAKWVMDTYWAVDWNAIHGKPLHAAWASSPAPGSVTLTAEQIERLGITAEELQAAVT